MDISRQRPITLRSPSSHRFTASLLLMTGAIGYGGALCAGGDYRNAVVLAALSLCVAVIVAAPIAIEAVLLAWFATTPLLSFYLRYPLDRSVITYNRLVFVLLIGMLILESRPPTKIAAAIGSVYSSQLRAMLSITRFEIAWAVLSLLALGSALAHSNNAPYALRIAIDTFWLPLFAFHFARKCFDLRTGGRWLLLGCMGLAVFLFATGAFELATGVDLFQYKGAELVREGERRVNGPFAADSSFAIICLILFLFLLAAPGLIRARFDRAGKLIYTVATAAAALGALLSLFRAVAFALVVCWIAQRWWSPGGRKGADLRRLLPAASLTVVILIAIASLIATITPTKSGRLTDPRSAFGRLATWQAAAVIALEHPVFGVGIANYSDYFDASHYYSDEPSEEILDAKAGDSPHSNLLWIASELGLPGFGAYIAANLYLFLMGWRALKRAPDSRRQIAAACFLAIVVAYWIPGFTLASGSYSDLNLCFLFLLGALSTQFRGAPTASGRFEEAVEFKD